MAPISAKRFVLGCVVFCFSLCLAVIGAALLQIVALGGIVLGRYIFAEKDTPTSNRVGIVVLAAIAAFGVFFYFGHEWLERHELKLTLAQRAAVGAAMCIVIIAIQFRRWRKAIALQASGA